MAGKNLKKRNHLNKSKLINHHDRVDSLLKSEEEKVRTMKMKKKKEIEMKFEKRLLKYEELPDYMKDNEFILDYYRSEWPLKETFRSIFLLHNETLNIWTHLGGFFIFLALTVLSLMETPPDVVIDLLFFDFSRIRMIRMPLMMMMKNASEISSSTVTQAEQRGLVFEFKAEGYHNKVTNIPRWPLLVFLMGAMGCLICSSISHLLACHSRRLNLFFWRLDYAGISLMIVCSFFAPIYYAFFCHPISLFFYLSSITLLGILVIITLLAPVLSSPQFRSFRATLFLTMGFSGVVPAAHALLLHWEHNQIFVALAYELAMAIFYAIGVVFYVSRIPERWKPGAFDIAGHSHQIFHVFVVAGALAHCGATLVLLEWRLNSPMCQIS